MARGFWGIIKLAVFILVLPALAAVILGFQKEMQTISGGSQVFWWGVIAYTVFHLFIFTPQEIFRFWQGVFMEICAFAGSTANLIVTVVPIITTVLLLLYFLVAVVFRQTWGQPSLIFLTGFTITLHVILSAQELYEADETRLKGHYLMNLALAFIVNMVILSALLDLVFKKFSFWSFGENVLKIAEQIYTHLLHTAGIRW